MDEVIAWLLWYNRARLHSTLDYASPMRFESTSGRYSAQHPRSVLQRSEPSRQTGQSLLDSIRLRLLARASVRVERLVADAVIEAGMRARRSGAPADATARDLDNLPSGITSPAAIGLLDLPWTPLFIFICFVIHFWIGVLAIAGAAIIMVLAIANERSSRDAMSRLSGLAARFYVASDAELTSAETIHALGANKRFRDRRALSRAEFVGAQTEMALSGAGYASATKATRMLLQSAALGLGAFLAVERQISPGAIIAATILTARAFAPVEQIVGGWRQIGMGSRHTKRCASSSPMPHKSANARRCRRRKAGLTLKL